MRYLTFAPDPRFFQIFFQVIFLSYGILFLHWTPDWLHYAISTGGCLFFNYAAESLRQRRFLSLSGPLGWNRWGYSVLISAASLCLLLKTGHWSVSLLAAFLTVASKYLFRVGPKHIFNPSAFGIVATIVLTGAAWLSPGQWGTGAVLFFFVVTLGTIVVTRVQKLDVSLAFLVTFVGLLYWRQVYVLGWPVDHFEHAVSTGSLLLFTFFMISDPRTAPNHPLARVLWAMGIAAVSFYLAAFRWMNNTPLWVLVAAAPLVPLLDVFFKAERFQWKAAPLSITILSTFKKTIMKPFANKLAALLVLAAMISQQAAAFCGFYVSKADGTLKNKTSQVIMVRDGNRNVITMYNDFQGNFKDFAMVVPVPVVLKKSDIKVVDPAIFQTLNDYSKPRLVEYYDQNPCQRPEYEALRSMAPTAALDQVVVIGYGSSKKKDLGVRIEAKYLVGEYDILILSAKESTGLKTWLEENGYKIPAGADEVLEPYIKSNLKFFVVKVNEAEKKKLGGNFLSPIQITFNSPKFMLPIRLGMANADGDQDMVVYAFSKTGRVECTNYRTVALPTGKKVPLFVKDNFSPFYANLFQHQWKGEGKAVALLEYAWDVSPKNFVKCDPCVATAPSAQDLVQAGVWWINRNWADYSDVAEAEAYSDNVHFTRLHLRYNRRSFPQDLQFQVTPNKESYQARYIVTHPATGNLDCEEGRRYLKALKERRQDELEMLAYLTGKGYGDWDVVQEVAIPAAASYRTVALARPEKGGNRQGLLWAAIGLLGAGTLIRWGRRK